MVICWWFWRFKESLLYFWSFLSIELVFESPFFLISFSWIVWGLALDLEFDTLFCALLEGKLTFIWFCLFVVLTACGRRFLLSFIVWVEVDSFPWEPIDFETALYLSWEDWYCCWFFDACFIFVLGFDFWGARKKFCFIIILLFWFFDPVELLSSAKSL